MVAYGEWNDPIEYTETWTLGIIDSGGLWDGNFGLTEKTISPVPTEDGAPIPENEYRLAGSLGPRHFYGAYELDRESTSNHPDLNDGRYGTPGLSSDAWANLYTPGDSLSSWDFGPTLTPNEGGVDAPILTYSHTDEPGPGSLGFNIHEEKWTAGAVEFTPEWAIRANANWNAILGIPPAPTENHLYTEVDPENVGSARLTEPVSLQAAFSLAGDSRWGFYVVDTDTPADGWVVSNPAAVGLVPFDGQRIMGDSQGPFGSFEYDIAPIEAWKQEAGISTTYTVPQIKMPHIGVAWDGTWPGDFLADPKQYPALPTITFTYKWRTARWRWVLAEPITAPYRRTTGRTDNRAGGPARNYPPTKGLQDGRRTSGGYW